MVNGQLFKLPRTTAPSDRGNFIEAIPRLVKFGRKLLFIFLGLLLHIHLKRCDDYLAAVEDAFCTEIDYAQLVKIYGSPERSQYNAEVRYSPAVCMGARKAKVIGKPAYAHVSTSICERQNLTMRMGMRRFTRLTNAFSKKVENHEHAIAIHYMYYNFCRIHQSLRVTPAMEAGVSDHVWSIEEVIRLLK